MGDVRPPRPSAGDDNGVQQRWVTVLVTGFGLFKNFSHNPSYLITTLLPNILAPSSSPSAPDSTSQPWIRLFIHPEPLRVSYPTISRTIPELLSTLRPDYVLHLGMAAGRQYYALETLAHRDGYTIPDIDGCDGIACGTDIWTKKSYPPILHADWHRADVLARWRDELKLDDRPVADVRLSNDPGRYLCDYIFYESLSERWTSTTPPLPSQQPEPVEPSEPTEGMDHTTSSTTTASTTTGSKVAFLHVPSHADQIGLQRGALVTAAAIRALVSSWESGLRREHEPGC